MKEKCINLTFTFRFSADVKKRINQSKVEVIITEGPLGELNVLLGVAEDFLLRIKV